jgi:Fe2+ transport system protein B
MAGERITIALAGNPNSGKTTVFNNLTGSRQRVANWPGVTVEKKEGFCQHKGRPIMVVDEVIARDYIIGEKPDVVVDVVDASNLERNLYLSVQLLEMQPKMIIALNMMDVAASRGYQIDLPGLSHLLGVPVIPMVAARGQGTRELLDAIVAVEAGEIKVEAINIQYGRDVEEEIAKLEKQVSASLQINGYPPRWLAVKLLEDDREIIEKIRQG